MSADVETQPLERMREVAALLAKGLARWRARAKQAGIIDVQKSPPVGENCLELPRETRLSVGTRGLSPRDDGEGK